MNEALGKDPCAEFAKNILGAVNSKKNPALAGGDLAKIFETFLANGGDYTRVMPPGSAGYGNPIGNIMDKGGARIYLSPATDLQAAFDANGTLAELFHLAGSKKHYGDRALADAARAIRGYAALADERLRPQDNIYSGSYKKGPKEAPDYGYSIYFHTIQRIKCSVRGLSQ
ncbi:MAG: hypothetical protein H7Z16_02825 [Pyrinomonadaceae bacterium]|nr:hypothetical protein [Pyrinomonadaceae bacterium]